MDDAQQVVAQVSPIIESLKHKPGALLPILHAVQSELDYIPNSAIPLIADGLQLSRAEVHGVISFYHLFRSSPPGRHIVQICQAEACQAMGSRKLTEHARSRLGIDFGETSADGAVTLQNVYCLGNCACSPSIRIDDTIHARVDAERFDQLVADLIGSTAGER